MRGDSDWRCKESCYKGWDINIPEDETIAK